MVLEKTFESHLDCKEIQPVHPKGNQPWISLEGLMLKLKLQYFGHLMWRADSMEKTLMLGKIEGRKRRGWQMMRWLEGITDSMDTSLSKLQKMVKAQGSLVCCSPWGHKVLDTTEWLDNNNNHKESYINKIDVNDIVTFLEIHKLQWLTQKIENLKNITPIKQNWFCN